MSERTDRSQADEALRQIQHVPTIAARVLAGAADRLTKVDPTEPLTVVGWGDAIDIASEPALKGMPLIVHEDTTDRVRALMPELVTGQTRGEYALRIRRAIRIDALHREADAAYAAGRQVRADLDVQVARAHGVEAAEA